MHALRCLTSNDWPAWERLWGECPEREPFAHPVFLKALAGGDGEPTCFVLESELGLMHYPCLLRDLSEQPWGQSGYDLLGPPQVWGGPFVTRATDRSALVQAFFAEYAAWASRVGGVSEYLSFSPITSDHEGYPGSVEERMPIVIRDLDLDEADLLKNYEHKVRKNVKRALASGLRVEVDTDGTHLKEFLDIYYGTMDRRGAPSRFYFEPTVFEDITHKIPEGCVFFHVWDGDTIVSTECVLTGPRTMYSFLGGTREQAFDKRPNDLLKHTAILWGRSTGRRHFVLGGGNVPDDGIFRYKKAFAPKGVVSLRIGRWSMDPVAIAALTARRRAWEAEQGRDWAPRAGFFPMYRAPSAG